MVDHRYTEDRLTVKIKYKTLKRLFKVFPILNKKESMASYFERLSDELNNNGGN